MNQYSGSSSVACRFPRVPRHFQGVHRIIMIFIMTLSYHFSFSVLTFALMWKSHVGKTAGSFSGMKSVIANCSSRPLSVFFTSGIHAPITPPSPPKDKFHPLSTCPFNAWHNEMGRVHKASVSRITKHAGGLEESPCAGVCVCQLTQSLFPWNTVFYLEEQLTNYDDQTWNLADISQK